MPREMKGKSINMPQSSERVSIDIALENIYSLFNKWGLSEKDYVFVDEFAYYLQGYKVEAKEIKSGHLDVYINPERLPWKDKGERSIIPPKESKEINEWADLMQETGYSLDMLRARPEIFNVPSVSYKLPSGKFINLMRVYEMTEEFVKQTLMHYSLEDVGIEKIKEWLDKLKIIKTAAKAKKDIRLANLCEDKLVESKKRWNKIL